MAILNNLISHWPLNEASGNAIDVHGGINLTDKNTVGIGTIGGQAARDFESGNLEYFETPDNASLSMGDIDFTLCIEVEFESVPGTSSVASLMAKRNAYISSLEYYLRYAGDVGAFNLQVSADGGFTTFGNATASTFGAATAGVKYIVMAWHDSANNQLGISVNGVENVASYSSGLPNGTAYFAIGATVEGTSGNNTVSEYFDGRARRASVWKRVLSPTERTFMYNGGAGRAYPFVAGGLKSRRLALVQGGRVREIGREGVSIA